MERESRSMDRWYPLNADANFGRPEVGALIAVQHAVWRVSGIQDVPALSDEDRDAWLRSGMPDLASWALRPYRVRAIHVGGKPPKHPPPHSGEYVMNIPAGYRPTWRVYRNGRWPQCSCCGEPMPCRAELTDRVVEAATDRMADFEQRMPGCCWACKEPITQRQRAVVYSGINLDHPMGPTVRFHLRAKCRNAAHRYEERWLAADEARERILTYPECGGTLVVHHDGDSECRGGLDDCHGNDTHDHANLVACYAQSHECPRGCGYGGHPGCRPRPRTRRSTWTLS